MNNPLLKKTQKKFLIIPHLEREEFILSYLNRIKKANAYPSLISVVKTIFGKKITTMNLVKGNFNKFIFSEHTGLSETQINSLFIQEHQNEFYSVDCLLICPFCILKQNYIPIAWYKKDHICPIHSIPYISRCPHCNTLLHWDTKKIEVCHFCQCAINLNIEKHIIHHDSSIEKSDIYLVYKIFFNDQVYSPSNNTMYNLEYLSSKFIKCVEFIENPEKYLMNEIRKIFIKINEKYPNKKSIKYDFTSYFFKIIKYIKHSTTDEYNKTHIIDFIELINNDLYLEILNNYDDKFFYFISGGFFNFNLKIKFIEKLLKSDPEVINFFKRNYVTNNKKEEITIDDFIFICKNITYQVNTKNINDNFVYFSDLSTETKIKILHEIFYSPVILYNFNYESMLSNIKIIKADLKKLLDFN